jgi:hypothetical protein
LGKRFQRRRLKKSANQKQELPMAAMFVNGLELTVEEQTRKNSNFPVRGIFKNPREIIVNIFR